MSNSQSNRRDFLKASAVGGTLLASQLVIPTVHAAEDRGSIKVGIIGCGGRGGGAGRDVLKAADGVEIVALADAFDDRLQSCLKRLQNETRNPTVKKFGNTVNVPKDRQFVGLDAYKKLLALEDVNYVILATPPGFRPMLLEAAVAAKKTIFTEKPVAVDPTGIRKVFKAYDDALKAGLKIAAGTQRRHQTNYLETMKRIHGGEIGDIVAARCYWNQGGLWDKPQQQTWSDLEWHIRNWLYFTWMSGDHIVEQHVHNIDVVNWALTKDADNPAHPISAVGLGGRQARTDPKRYGHIFDHFAIDFTYDNDVHVFSSCRQQVGTEQNVSEALVGTKGMAFTSNRRPAKVNGENVIKRGEDNLPYVQEHTDLINAVRKGTRLNELKNVATSTATAIMGRMAAYTGKQVTWDFLINESKLNLMPGEVNWDMKIAMPAVAIPGQTPLT